MNKMLFVIFMLLLGILNCASADVKSSLPDKVKISIIAVGIGESGEGFPESLATFWEPIPIASEIIPQSVKLQCIDFSQKKLIEFTQPEPEKSFIDPLKLQQGKDKSLRRLKTIKSELMSSKFKLVDQCISSNIKPTKDQLDWLMSEIERMKNKKNPSNIIYYDSTGGVNQEKLQFANTADVYKYIQQKVSESLRSSDKMDMDFIILYELPLGNNKSGPGGTINPPPLPSACSEVSKNSLMQGMQFVSLAKATQNQNLRKENLNNAQELFNRAIDESKAAGGCCAKALMNRGVARDLLRQPDLALEDLKAAVDERCGPPDMEALYNLACYYSKHSSRNSSSPTFTLGLALSSLEKAVEAGFKDCDTLLKDSDLANLRGDKDYLERVRKMLNKHNIYCSLPPPRK